METSYRDDKQIVGTFNDEYDKIEFYEVLDSFKGYTVLKKSGAEDYYLYLEAGALSCEHYDNKETLIRNLDKVTWDFTKLFFWADSRFVTEYGKENYDILVSLYQSIQMVKLRNLDMDMVVEEARAKGIFAYLYCKFYIALMNRRQRVVGMKKIIRELKIIWPS